MKVELLYYDMLYRFGTLCCEAELSGYQTLRVNTDFLESSAGHGVISHITSLALSPLCYLHSAELPDVHHTKAES